MVRHRLASALLIALVSSGCATQFAGYEPGPHAVTVDETVLRDQARGRDIALRVAHPADAGSYPVVVFSHGAFCYPERYAVVTDHWVSHGYIVIAPNHLDSPNNRERMGADQVARLLESRIEDLAAVADGVGAIAEKTNMASRPDTARMAIAGHSFGGMLAQIEAGLMLKDPTTGAAVSRADPRFRAAVVMSGVGPMPQMAENAFAGLKGPLIASGGTLDEGNVGSGQVFPWEWRMSPYTLAPPGDKYSVVLDRGDHYLGGLICREDRGGEDDPEGAAIVRALQTAFLDAYLKDDREARRFLATADVGALTGHRARFERK
jgi:predicted dienelactone hydrolase